MYASILAFEIRKQLINMFRVLVSSPRLAPRTPHREHNLPQNLQQDQRESANCSEAQHWRRERERRERELSRQQPMVGVLIRVFVVWGLTGGCKPTVRPRGVLLPIPPSAQDLEADYRSARTTRILPVA